MVTSATAAKLNHLRFSSAGQELPRRVRAVWPRSCGIQKRWIGFGFPEQDGLRRGDARCAVAAATTFLITWRRQPFVDDEPGFQKEDRSFRKSRDDFFNSYHETIDGARALCAVTTRGTTTTCVARVRGSLFCATSSEVIPRSSPHSSGIDGHGVAGKRNYARRILTTMRARL